MSVTFIILYSSIIDTYLLSKGVATVFRAWGTSNKIHFNGVEEFEEMHAFARTVLSDLMFFSKCFFVVY